LIYNGVPHQRSESSWGHSFYYLHQGGYVFVVCLLATLLKNFQTDLPEIFREGWQWASEQMIKFWWWSESPSGYRDCFPDSSLSGAM